MFEPNGKKNYHHYFNSYHVYMLCVVDIYACNPCKRMDAFKFKHNFYYKNINNQ